ncbi:hypothetical protein [Variovorax sp. GB1P17]|uniref:hypothetical protein n=1 Tax=Variovorax sp. GB1P17 TaxID=3443740 RepID=UPI003F44E87D
MKSTRYILLAIMLAVTGLARAESAVGGIGVVKCDVWLQARKTPRQDNAVVTEGMLLSWVQGYLSSKNSDGSEDKMVLSVPDHKLINRVLDTVCAKNPEAQIHAIAHDFANSAMELYQSEKRK